MESGTVNTAEGTVNPADWRAAICELAAWQRPSASDGERRAAEAIRERLQALGWEAEVEEERAHGGYWWPVALANLLGVAASAIPARGLRRLAASAAAAMASAAIWDDVGGGELWWRRKLLPHRSTWNVVAHGGDPTAQRTLVFIAHHDAAHAGLVFHPTLGRVPPRLFPGAYARGTRHFPIMYLVWLGPTLVALGQLLGVRRMRQLGTALAAGSAAAMVDIGLRSVVPGANDNLSAVGALIALADRFRDEPLAGLRLVLVSTGSEESFMEGMQGYVRRHRAELDPERTEFLCLECLGGPELVVLEGEGMLRMREYSKRVRERLQAAANRLGIEVTRGLHTVAATDALIPLRRGYVAGTLASIDSFTKLPLNYHWATDVPEALHWETIERAIEICERYARDSVDGVGAHAAG